jgi:hypothetical protein
MRKAIEKKNIIVMTLKTDMVSEEKLKGTANLLIRSIHPLPSR